MSASADILCEVAAGRRETLRSLVKAKLFARLFAISQQHVRDKRRQLVVFSFDFIAHQINLNGIFERGELDTVFKWLSGYPGAFDGVAIDVGANIGNHSLYFSDFNEAVLPK